MRLFISIYGYIIVYYFILTYHACITLQIDYGVLYGVLYTIKSR